MEAEKKLLLPQNEHGAYLIRDSESRRNDYSLSVRDGDTVKHYRIRQLDEGGFFIARRTTFRTLQDLVEHYGRDADGLCVNLRKPCVQVGQKYYNYIFLFDPLGRTSVTISSKHKFTFICLGACLCLAKTSKYFNGILFTVAGLWCWPSRSLMTLVFFLDN